MEQLKAGQRFPGTVEGYTSEGHGVVRVDGAVVFVPGTVRGDRINLRITKIGKHTAWGEAVQILGASPARRPPDCPWFGQCGGCDFRHLSYEEELWAKRRRVEDALRRIGGTDIPVEEILGSVRPRGEESGGQSRKKLWTDGTDYDKINHVLCPPGYGTGYRNKSQFPVGPDGTVGFYRAGSHQVVPVAAAGQPGCLIQAGAANRTAQAVQAWIKRYGVPGYDERTGRGLVRHVYVRTNSAGESLCCVVANGRALPREPELAGMVRAAAPGTVGVLLNSNTKPGNVVLGDRYRAIWGRDFLMDTLRGLSFRLSVPSFFQVNREQAEVLYGKALEYAALTGTETVLDLYCGVGTITLCLARQAGRVIGAEIVPQAVEDARGNARRNGIENAEFLRADAPEAAARLAEEGFRPDVVTVDPPRKGLTEDAVRAAAAMGPERIVYVSCDPGTLGRDIARFAPLGYQAVRAAAVDMFPGTKHVESVVLLSRQSVPSDGA